MAARRRREPKQARSREMVERILDGAVRVLLEHGIHDASTNRIAREAGVSPGSLYQYFADKHEIVDAIAVRTVDEASRSMEPVLRKSALLPPDQAIPLVLGAALDALQIQSELLRALTDYRPVEDQRRNVEGLIARMADRVNIALAMQAGEATPETERRSWLIVEICQNTLIRYVLDQPGFGREELIADLSGIVLGLVPQVPVKV